MALCAEGKADGTARPECTGPLSEAQAPNHSRLIARDAICLL